MWRHFHDGINFFSVHSFPFIGFYWYFLRVVTIRPNPELEDDQIGVGTWFLLPSFVKPKPLVIRTCFLFIIKPHFFKVHTFLIDFSFLLPDFSSKMMHLLKLMTFFWPIWLLATTLNNFFLIYLFIFGCVWSSLLCAGIL